MIKFVRTVTASAAAVVLAVLFAVQAQAAPTPQAAQSQQGDGDLIFAGVAGLFILAAAFGVIIYAARHRNTEN